MLCLLFVCVYIWVLCTIRICWCWTWHVIRSLLDQFQEYSGYCADLTAIIFGIIGSSFRGHLQIRCTIDVTAECFIAKSRISCGIWVSRSDAVGDGGLLGCEVVWLVVPEVKNEPRVFCFFSFFFFSSSSSFLFLLRRLLLFFFVFFFFFVVVVFVFFFSSSSSSSFLLRLLLPLLLLFFFVFVFFFFFFFKGQAALGYWLVIEEARSVFLQKVGSQSPNNTVAHPRLIPRISFSCIFVFRKGCFCILLSKISGRTCNTRISGLNNICFPNL